MSVITSEWLASRCSPKKKKTHLNLDVSQMIRSVTALPVSLMFNVRQMQESLSVTAASHSGANRMVKEKGSEETADLCMNGKKRDFSHFCRYSEMKDSFKDIRRRERRLFSDAQKLLQPPCSADFDAAQHEKRLVIEFSRVSQSLARV